MTPVTVLMPVYNGALFVGEAVESILGQTAGDLELLVVDDGSTDRTAEIVRGYRDPRIRLVESPANQGIVAALNRGLDLAQGKYVVRMDADDVSLPDRVEKQVRYMDQHPEVGVCGGSVQVFDAKGEEPVPVLRERRHEALACRLVFETVLAHPTVILRGELVRGGLRYDAGYPHAEDYELWSRAARLTRLAVLPELVLRYRAHPGTVSSLNHRAQRRSTQRIRLREVRALGIEPTFEEAQLHASLARWKLELGPAYVDAVRRWLEALAAANRRSRRLPEEAFERMLHHRLARVVRNAAEHGRGSGDG
jgi:glycosyltransferase involved in cell wall biosynthesis